MCELVVTVRHRPAGAVRALCARTAAEAVRAGPLCTGTVWD